MHFFLYFAMFAKLRHLEYKNSIFSTLNKNELQRSCYYARRRHHELKDEGTTVKVEPAVNSKNAPPDVKTESDTDDCEWLEQEATEYKVNLNVTPTQTVPCMYKHNKSTIITPMLWGFIPANHKV
jgi:hypothetical protein